MRTDEIFTGEDMELTTLTFSSKISIFKKMELVFFYFEVAIYIRVTIRDSWGYENVLYVINVIYIRMSYQF